MNPGPVILSSVLMSNNIQKITLILRKNLFVGGRGRIDTTNISRTKLFDNFILSSQGS